MVERSSRGGGEKVELAMSSRFLGIWRRCALAGAAAAVLSAGSARASISEVPDVEDRAWTVGNTRFSTGLKYTDDGRVLTTGVRDRSRNLDWAAGASGLGFSIVLRAAPDDAPPDADPAGFASVTLTEGSAWTLVHAMTQPSSDGTVRFELALASREAPIAVTWALVSHPESPVLRSSISVTNTGLRRVLLEGVDGLDAELTASAGALASLTVDNFNWGHAATSFQTKQATLKAGVSVLARTGPGGSQSAWMALRSSKWNAGVFLGWEWSGPGLLEAAGAGKGTTSLAVGFAPGTFAHVLAPGEGFVSPVAFIGVFSGNLDAAGAATRTFVARRIAPRCRRLISRGPASTPGVTASASTGPGSRASSTTRRGWASRPSRWTRAGPRVSETGGRTPFDFPKD